MVGDPETATRVLNGALAVTADAPAAILVRARILRADIAHAMGEDGLATMLLAAVGATTLDAGERTVRGPGELVGENVRRAIR